MSDQLTFTPEQIDYVRTVLANARSLLDNVHCYDTHEYAECSIAIDILSGMTIEEAEENNNDEE